MTANHVLQLPHKDFSTLHNMLIASGFKFSTPPYTRFRAVGTDISCTLYQSGKLMIQGKRAMDFIELVMRPKFPYLFATDFSTQNETPTKFPKIAHIGSDETGKGDFFGPLVIAALYADPAGIDKLIAMGATDSKLLTDDKIIPLATAIENAFPSAVVTLFPNEYNPLYASIGNLNHLLAFAHAKAIAQLKNKTQAELAWVDQFSTAPLVSNELRKQGVNIKIEQFVRGESDPVIAGASLIARKHFVLGMAKLENEYGEKLPKGAGQPVINAGVKILNTRGKGFFSHVAKTHFKTIETILHRS